jgi:hypothetical protein
VWNAKAKAFRRSVQASPLPYHFYRFALLSAILSGDDTKVAHARSAIQFSYDAQKPFSVSSLLTWHTLRLTKIPLQTSVGFMVRGKREASHSSAATLDDGGHIKGQARVPTIR